MHTEHGRRTSARGRSLRAVGVAAGLLAAGTLQAATYTWNIGGTGTWNDMTTANWTPNTGLPQNADTALLTRVDASNIDIGYTAGNLSGSGLAQLTIGNTGGGTTTLALGGSYALYTQRFTLNSGGKVAQSGGTLYLTLGNNNCVLNTGGTYELSGGTLDLEANGPSANQNNHLDVRGGTMNQSGGTLVSGWDVNVYRGSYNLTGGTCDPRGFHVFADAGQTATVTVSGTGTLIANAGNESLFVGGTFPATLAAGTSVLNQTGGTVTINSGYGLYVMGNGTYNLTGGAFSANMIVSRLGGTFVHDTAGSSTVAYELRVADYVGSTAPAYAEMKQGTIVCRSIQVGCLYPGYGTMDPGGAGTLTHSGGTISVNNSGYAGTGLYLSHDNATVDSTYLLQGGTLVDRNWAKTYIAPRGTLRGYGDYNLREAFNLNGRVIADGYGQDRDLNITSYNGLQNSTDNTSDKGWYATNHGRLNLKPFTVSGGNTYYWGEQGDLDLVNAVRLTFPGTASGTLTGRLYAPDHSAVPTLDSYYRPLAVYEFSGPTFSSVDLTFRLDDALLASYYGYAGPAAPLLAMRYSGGSWQWLPATLDWATKTMTVSGVTGFSFFTVTALPEPGALALLVLLLPVLGHRRRR